WTPACRRPHQPPPHPHFPALEGLVAKPLGFLIRGELMPKTTYQTYTTETPIETYRADAIRRSAMCGAIAARYPALGDVGKEAAEILAQIDTRCTDLQQAEDDQVRARAIEDAAKLDVVDVYTEIRRTMAVKNQDVMTLLPDAPSTLGRLGAKNFGGRANQ